MLSQGCDVEPVRRITCFHNLTRRLHEVNSAGVDAHVMTHVSLIAHNTAVAQLRQELNLGRPWWQEIENCLCVMKLY